MIQPTGVLSVVSDFMDKAKRCEGLAENMINNDCFNTAIEQKLQAEKLKSQAGVEFLLWMLASLNMPDEPNPWKELQEKKS